MAGSKLIQTIQNMTKVSNGGNISLVFGEVTSVSPLKIQIDNRFEIDEQFLILSMLVKETTIQIPNNEFPSHTHIILQHITNPGGTDSHTHIIPEMSTKPSLSNITLWRGLEVGDKVRILSLNDGQLFYVIEREEM